MKRILRLTLSSAMLLSMVACSSDDNAAETTENGTEENIGTNTYTPGTYTIETTGHNGKMVVDVTFDEESIKDIVVGENEETGFMGDQAFEHMISNIVTRQSLDVDALSGATVSGLAVRNAVTEAVEEAGGSKDALQIPAEEDDTKYEDATTEVVVIGSGAAGMAATMQAEELGLDVILVEQLGLIGGSSVRAGYMVGGDTIVQEEQGIDFTTEDWVDHIVKPREGVDIGLWDEEAALQAAKNDGENIDWLYNLGVEFGPVNLEWQHYGPEGSRLGPFVMEAMQKNLDEKDMDYRLNTRATEFIMEDEAVVGVTVEAPNGENYDIYADAVIVATGGYNASQDMVEKYDPEHAGFPTDVSIGSDGSGMNMVEDIGGVLVYMDQSNYHGLAAMWNGASRSLTLPAGNGALAVNAEGDRYADESGSYELLTQGTMAQENNTAYCIMDQELMDLDVIQHDTGLSNVKEMWVKADTLEELAKELGIDYAGLKETVDNYTSYVENEEDLEFGKNPQFMRSDFTNPPFYGVEASVETHTNHGGILTDRESHVLDENEAIIPGLFAAGETSASKTTGAFTYRTSIDQGRRSAMKIYEMLKNN